MERVIGQLFSGFMVKLYATGMAVYIAHYAYVSLMNLNHAVLAVL